MFEDLSPARHRIRRASPGRLRAMARRIAAPIADDPAAMDDYWDMEEKVALLPRPDAEELARLIRLELSREPQHATEVT